MFIILFALPYNIFCYDIVIIIIIFKIPYFLNVLMIIIIIIVFYSTIITIVLYSY